MTGRFCVAINVLAFVAACSGKPPSSTDTENGSEPDYYQQIANAGGASGNVDEATAFRQFYPDRSVQTLMEEYFVEMFVFKGGMNGQEVSTKLFRWVDPPRFVWDPAVTETERSLLAPNLTSAVAGLTGGVLDSSFAADGESTVGKTGYVMVQVVDNLSALGSTEVVPSEDGRIIGGQLRFDRRYLATSIDPLPIIWHEVGHLLSNTLHSGMLANIMSYNFSPVNVVQTYEKDAFNLLYRLQPGMTWDELRDAGVVSFEVDDVKPLLISAELTNQVKRGNKATLVGARLAYRWGCNETNLSFPTATLNGAPVEVLTYAASSTVGELGTCNRLSLRIPADASSGPLIIQTTYGAGDSNSIELLVTD